MPAGRSISAAELAEVLQQEQLHMGELLGTIHSMRYTGAVTLKFLDGVPQEVELGRPHVVKFPKGVDKPLDSTAPRASSSTAIASRGRG